MMSVCGEEGCGRASGSVEGGDGGGGWGGGGIRGDGGGGGVVVVVVAVVVVVERGVVGVRVVVEEGEWFLLLRIFIF